MNGEPKPTKLRARFDVLASTALREVSPGLRRELLLHWIGKVFATIRSAAPRVDADASIITAKLLEKRTRHPNPAFLSATERLDLVILSNPWTALLAGCDYTLYQAMLRACSALDALSAADEKEPEIRAVSWLTQSIIYLESVAPEGTRALVAALDAVLREAIDLTRAQAPPESLERSPGWAVFDDDLAMTQLGALRLTIRHPSDVSVAGIAVAIRQLVAAVNEAHIAGGGSGLRLDRWRVGERAPELVSIVA